MLTFTAAEHLYESLPTEDQIAWTSGTAIVGLFEQPFPADQAEKSSKNKKNKKWYGLDPRTIQRLWDQESERASTDGTWYHDAQEQRLLALESILREGVRIPVMPCHYDAQGRKLAPKQRLEQGVYPEHFLYLKSAGICGQADICERVGNLINIGDYKTNKKMDFESYKNWEGVSKKMLGPLAHLDDCNWYHYCIQLSLYMYIALKHNPTCKPGKMTIYHVRFKSLQTEPDPVTGETQDLVDQYDYPIYERDLEGHPIVKSSTAYEVPYLKAEIESILRWFTANKHLLPAKTH